MPPPPADLSPLSPLGPPALLALALLGLLYWAALAVLAARCVARVPRVAALPAVARHRWPRVSAVVPARDEAAELEGALRSRLAEGYPALEVVLVDDRSTDGTGALADRLAEAEPRLRVVHLDALPEGWLGKVHALQRGLEASSGEWLLFSDADIHLAPGTLARIVAYAEARGDEHVCVLPEFTSRGPLLVATLCTLMRLVCTGGRPWAVGDPRSSAAVGVGAFNLVRREALARTPGLPWLRMEVGDDMALGVMLKACGARQQVLNGRGAVRLAFYPHLGALVRAVEKNGATLPLPAMLAACALLLALEWSPAVALAAGLWAGAPHLALLGAAGWGVAGAASLAVARWLGFSPWSAALPFLGSLPLAWALARSAALAAWRGGVRWRGTFYPLAAVRAGTRLGRGGLRLREPPAFPASPGIPTAAGPGAPEGGAGASRGRGGTG
jgi:hypothetical protein